MARPDPGKGRQRGGIERRCWSKAIKKDLKPLDIITKSRLNAVALIMATGGSTNAVLHYLAITHAAGHRWTIDDFERMRKKVPVLCDLKPSGQYVMTDLHEVGGVPQVLKLLLNQGLLQWRLHDDHRPHDGRRAGQRARPAAPDQDVIRQPDNRFTRRAIRHPQGQSGTRGLRAKITGPANPVLTGPPACSTASRSAWTPSWRTRSTTAMCWCSVTRAEGRPGMREMLAPTSAIIGGAWAKRCPDHRRPLRRHLGHGGRPHIRAGGAGGRFCWRWWKKATDHGGCAPTADPAERRRGYHRRASRQMDRTAAALHQGVMYKFALLASSASKGA